MLSCVQSVQTSSSIPRSYVLKAVVQQVNMFWQFFRLDMGKIGQIYEQLLPNMSEIGMYQCSEVEEQSLSQLYCCLAVIGPGTPDFGFEQE